MRKGRFECSGGHQGTTTTGLQRSSLPSAAQSSSQLLNSCRKQLLVSLFLGGGGEYPRHPAK
eukprot:1762136-Alexandrium_andersonii.AAC.1